MPTSYHTARIVSVVPGVESVTKQFLRQSAYRRFVVKLYALSTRTVFDAYLAEETLDNAILLAVIG
mgnify:CR=1 FL=1